jgi:cytochrome c biogenesis protein CcmG, thiol:disulfide interchange protein DsbE
MIDKRIIVSIAISAAIFLIITVPGCSSNDAGYSGEPEAKDYSNDFELEDLDGRSISISDFAGKIVVLNFWATWCPPCKQEIPDFIEVYDEYRNRNVVFIGISNEDAATLESFAEDFGINYLILVDSVNITGQWGIRAIPTTFILDGNGRIIFKNVGMMLKDQLISALEEAL